MLITIGIVAYCITGILFAIWFYTLYENLKIKNIFPIIFLGSIVGLPFSIMYLIERVVYYSYDIIDSNIDWNKIVIKKRS